MLLSQAHMKKRGGRSIEKSDNEGEREREREEGGGGDNEPESCERERVLTVSHGCKIYTPSKA
jgi:hypothetical protein